jgi:toxin-antitoxin system PIN domain toxin
MSYSIDANILLYSSNVEAPEHARALAFLNTCANDPDLLCLTWPALMAYQRIATHPAIFNQPLSPEEAWENIRSLMRLPRARILVEDDDFAEVYRDVTKDLNIRGNLVPDAHIATILQQHGVRRIYTADSDFRKFPGLEVVNPIA